MEYIVLEETLYNGVITILVAGETLAVDLPENPSEEQISTACQKRADDYALEKGL